MLPSQENKAKLDQLSKNFKPDNCSFSIALDKECSLEACEEGVVGSLERLKKFIDNGYSCEGLDFEYSKIKIV